MQEFRTIDDIAKRKAEIRALADERREICRSKWNTIAHPAKKAPLTKVQKIVAFADKASVAFDGIMLGWKLYSKLKSIKRKH